MSLQRKISRALKSKNGPQLRQTIQASYDAFVAKFGREPGPNDPLIFDPDFDEPTPYDPDKFNRLMVETMVAAGIPGELIHAYVKTGLMLSEESYRLATRRDRKAWDSAIDEYFAMAKTPGH